MTDPTTDPRLILLDARDNVLVARAAIAQGVTLLIDGQPYTLNATVSMGHKLARHPIAAGDKIIKYGAPIGSATGAISPACHVHLHNMKSNYTATHSLDAARSTYGAAT